MKYVGLVRELGGPGNEGDDQVQQAHREAVRYTLTGFVEPDMRARVRTDGRDDDRVTGNMVAFRVTHRDTRVSGNDSMPDMELHDHVVIFNATFDAVEDKWKAAEMGHLKSQIPFYEAVYHNRMAHNLKALGYGIERQGKAFAIAGVSRDLVDKFSRRHAYIGKVADKLGITNPDTKSKLGATTRLGKSKDSPDILHGYWASRLTRQERKDLQSLKGLPSHECGVVKAVEYAIAHAFERRSVVEARKVYETAIRRGIGSVTPEAVVIEAKRQGILLKDGLATTKAVLAQEGRVVDFAAAGKGTCRAMGSGIHRKSGLLLTTPVPTNGHSSQPDPATLTPDQQAICRHVWESTDRVILIRGAAGTGKTHTMKAAIAGIDKPVVVVAPSSEASRGVLRRDGFQEADTLSRFLVDNKFQEQAKDGVVWVDEAGLVSMRQMDELFAAAGKLNARVVLQGDKRQHGAVERGATLRALEQFAGLPVAELTEIRRQKGSYKKVVEAISKGDITGGFDIISELGWIHQTPAFDHNKPLVDDYIAGLTAGKDVLVVAPTHAEGGEITAEIRKRLKEAKVIDGENERLVPTLVPAQWTDAQKGDALQYDGSEIIQFHRNSAAFRAGDRVGAAALAGAARTPQAAHFSVYRPGAIGLARGDVIRITANGKDKSGKHRLDNGSRYTVAGFTKEGDVALTNKWVISKDFGHIAPAYVSTSHAAQGRTVDRVLIAMGSESLPAVNAEQFYVSVSRGRESARIYTSMSPAVLRNAIQKADPRMTATELMGRPEPGHRRRPRARETFVRRVKQTYRWLRRKAEKAAVERFKPREMAHER